MTVIIIGGGIGGLTTAVALQRAGIESHVYERAPQLREVGAGISLWANATRALEIVGLASAVRARGLTPVEGEIRTWRGRVLSRPPASRPDVKSDVSVGVMHRAELLAALTANIDPSRLHLGYECSGFAADTAGVDAHFTNGESVRGDLVIGADGLHSIVRAQVCGPAPPRYAGYMAWRSVARIPDPPRRAIETWGRGQRFGIVPLGDGRVYWFATKNAATPLDANRARTQDLVAWFRGWHDPIEQLIESSDESTILQNAIADREPLPSWISDRVALLGDAAHPMTPNLGQGGCQAIEDAVVLAACLGRSTDVNAALRRYDERRTMRAAAIVRLSRRVGEMGQWENAFACALRNAAVWATPASVTARQLRSVVVHELLTADERAALSSTQRST